MNVLFAVILLVAVLLSLKFFVKIFERQNTEENDGALIIDNTTIYRRRRLAGGFYPVGYTGPYQPGEDLLPDSVWAAELAGLSLAALAALGEYGGSAGDVPYQVEDPNESNGNYDQPNTSVPVEDEPPQDAPPMPEAPAAQDAPATTDDPGPESTEFEPDDESRKIENDSGFGADTSDWDSDDIE